MTLEPGRELLHYRLIEQIGEGGMGVVWRAQDTSLDRQAAIKVLPAAVAGNTERLARFDREAKLLASLNHANIAAVYGLHEHDGVRFIAMELVPGEDLSQVLARGPLPHDRTMELARQVADALEAAHEQGVIHRDLKPANIKITPEGQVKVLDFGLAKAFEPDPTSSNVSPTLSPTLTSAGTIAGVILGTAAYMSPEQARGHVVDKRSDIWAFGCVLFEMLAGKLAFPGETISDTLAGVLKLEPDWQALPDDLPPSTERLLRRCLEKDRRKRLRDIGEARIRIDGTLGGDVDHVPAAAGSETGPPVAPARASRLPWVLAALALLVAVAAWVLPGLLRTEAPPPVMRFELAMPEGLDAGPPGAAAVLSPDGSRIAYIAGDPRRLHVRSIGQFEGMAINGTDGATQPFFSPDGQWIGYFADRALKKVSVQGGASVTLCPVQTPRGASWNEDGTIVFSPDTAAGLMRIADAGGEPGVLTDPDGEQGIRSHRWPRVLPGGKAVLFTVQPSGESFDDARTEVLDLASNERRVVASGGSFPRYAASGHVTYVHEGTVFAVPFDLETLRTTGNPVPVVERVAFNTANGGAQMDFSANGRLLYLTGSVSVTRRKVVRIDRDGTVEPLLDELRDYLTPRLSPEGTRLVLAYSTSSPAEDLWIYDLARGSTTRLTFSDEIDLGPVWTPDGERIVFTSRRDASVPNLHWKPADGSGDAERLTESDQAQFPDSVSPDGRYLLYREQGGGTGWDLRTLDLETRQSEMFLQTEFNESNASFSPDGRWVAYDSNESGEFQLYVRPFPPGGGKWQVSTAGGSNSRWSADGSRLYFLRDNSLVAADVSSDGKTFHAGAPRILIEEGLPSAGFFRNYDIGADGKVIAAVEDDLGNVEEPRAMLVLNWFEELRERSR